MKRSFSDPQDRRGVLRLVQGSIFGAAVGSTLKDWTHYLLGGTSGPTTFATISDGHWGAEDREYRSAHDAVLSRVNQEDVGFVIHLGDIVDSLLHPEQSIKALRNVRDKYLDRADVPYTVAHGNHDAVTEQEWNDVFGVDFDHLFEWGDIGIVVLDSADDERNEIQPNVEFLESALDELSEKEYVFVVSHYWFTRELRHELEGAGHSTEFSDEAAGLIHDRENVTAVIHGHNHGPTHRDVNYVTHDGTELPYVMSGVFGGYREEETIFGYRLWEIDSEGTIETRFLDLDGNVVNEHML